MNVDIRRALDLYANLRPVFNLPGIQARYDDVDLIVVRENTEDLYSGLEHEVIPGVVESLKVITRLHRNESPHSRSDTHAGTSGDWSRRFTRQTS